MMIPSDSTEACEKNVVAKFRACFSLRFDYQCDCWFTDAVVISSSRYVDAGRDISLYSGCICSDVNKHIVAATSEPNLSVL